MSAEPADFSRSQALLIGTSVYADPEFPALPAVANSLRGMRDLLGDPALCGWPDDRMVVLRDPSDARRLVQTVRRVARRTTDVLLVYFAGHGVISRRGQLCLILTDTEAAATGIALAGYVPRREATSRAQRALFLAGTAECLAAPCPHYSRRATMWSSGPSP